MKKNKMAAVLSAVMLLTACEPISQELPSSLSSESEYSHSESLQTDDSNSEEEAETVSYTEYIADVPEIVNVEENIKIEAEDCSLGGSLYTSAERKGFSGTGYVTGFYGGSADFIDINAEIESNQHYDITLCAAADSDVESYITVNGKKLQSFTIKGDGNFTRITLYGIYMHQGENAIAINSGADNYDLDYIEITNNESVYNDSFELSESASNEKMSTQASLLLKSMKMAFGKKIITGQYASSNENKELELIHKTTGKYPAIRFGDIGGYSNGSSPSENEIQAAIDWAEKGGIVGFMWYWNSPDKNSPSVYSKDTTFSLKLAVTSEDISQKPISELEKLYNNGIISLECLNLVKNIDAVSNALLVLADENIPVLWRPLHEAGGEWYWWGADGADAYRWLYDLMYKRMTEYHKLNNLIWIWNGQSADYMVDSSQYDIAAIDIYLSPEEEYGSRYEQFMWLKKITDNGKLLAISECSSVPSIDEMCRDNSLWSFFGLWFGEYLTDSKGNLSEIYTSKDELIKMYNAENAITLENYAEAYTHN